ncbi:MAG: hypothetical protein M3069_03730 [Chloroflexota bacterium]|nr:hypothetical protein [Chloroflexota bacterium]
MADVTVLAVLEGLTRSLCSYPSEYDRMFSDASTSCTSTWNVPSVN